MTLLLVAFGVVSLLELAFWWQPIWRWRRPLIYALIPSLAIISTLLLINQFTAGAVLLLAVSIYRIVNLMRVVAGRTQPDFLFHLSRRTSFLLIGFQIILLGIAELHSYFDIGAAPWLYGLAVVQLLGAIILNYSLAMSTKATTPRPVTEHLKDSELPSVTVAIPARNETSDLESCLQSLVKSTYPKLEILVLDDNSQTKRTSDIIRSFAHDGVRFLAGQTPPDFWLPKNYAYQQLTDAASGRLILFCGVDARFELDTIKRLVTDMCQRRKTMLSVMPRNQAPVPGNLEAMMVQPGRYAWELAPLRRAFNRPPVLSTCWLITAQTLHAAGSFKAIANSHAPEAFFALYSSRHQDGYSFIRSDEVIGLSTSKQLQEQRETAIRTRYPQSHRRPEVVLALSVAELTQLVTPYLLLFGSVVAGAWALTLISAISVALLNVFYADIVRLTYQQRLLRAYWLLPFATLYDIGLLNYSMWRYEFRSVIWKDRDIAFPVLQAIPELPKLD